MLNNPSFIIKYLNTEMIVLLFIVDAPRGLKGRFLEFRMYYDFVYLFFKL